MGSEKCFVSDRIASDRHTFAVPSLAPVAYEPFCSYLTARHPFVGLLRDYLRCATMKSPVMLAHFATGALLWRLSARRPE